jgi:hypothetical protein
MRKFSLLVVTLIAVQLCATSVIPMSVEQLSVAATQIVRAKAVTSMASWNADQTQIFTFTTFQSLETLKGSPSMQVVVRQMGGRVGNIEQKVSGVRRWQTGDESVLFLRPSEVGHGVMAVVGLFQGNFTVKRNGVAEAIASNGVADAIQYDRATGTSTHFHAAEITLRELRQRVSQVSGQRVLGQ